MIKEWTSLAYIYKITNLKNGRIYIGKTIRTIETRWREHLKDFHNHNKDNLPLYAAMNKYGVDNFVIEQIEECTDEEVSERERFWIENFQSFKQGYNATLGGDGKPYVDYDLVCTLYKELQNQSEVARRMNIERSTVVYILKNRHIDIKPSGEFMKEFSSKVVSCYNKEGEFIQSFPSISDAARYLQQEEQLTANLSSIKTNIGRNINGKRKSAYGLVWKS
jgi:hypothetical protein